MDSLENDDRHAETTTSDVFKRLNVNGASPKKPKNTNNTNNSDKNKDSIGQLQRRFSMASATDYCKN